MAKTVLRKRPVGLCLSLHSQDPLGWHLPLQCLLTTHSGGAVGVVCPCHLSSAGSAGWVHVPPPPTVRAAWEHCKSKKVGELGQQVDRRAGSALCTPKSGLGLAEVVGAYADGRLCVRLKQRPLQGMAPGAPSAGECPNWRRIRDVGQQRTPQLAGCVQGGRPGTLLVVIFKRFQS